MTCTGDWVSRKKSYPNVFVLIFHRWPQFSSHSAFSVQVLPCFVSPFQFKFCHVLSRLFSSSFAMFCLAFSVQVLSCFVLLFQFKFCHVLSCFFNSSFAVFYLRFSVQVLPCFVLLFKLFYPSTPSHCRHLCDHRVLFWCSGK